MVHTRSFLRRFVSGAKMWVTPLVVIACAIGGKSQLDGIRSEMGHLSDQLQTRVEQVQQSAGVRAEVDDSGVAELVAVLVHRCVEDPDKGPEQGTRRCERAVAGALMSRGDTLSIEGYRMWHKRVKVDSMTTDTVFIEQSGS